MGKPNQPVHLVQFAGMTVWVVGFFCVGSWLFGVRIELRLSCWIPDFARKVLKIFEIFFHSSGKLGKPNQPVYLVQFAGTAFGWFDLFVLVFGYSKSELNSFFLVGFMNLLGRFLQNFGALSQPAEPVGELDRSVCFRKGPSISV